MNNSPPARPSPYGRSPPIADPQGRQQAISPEMALVLPHPDGDKCVHGHGNCGGIEKGDRAGAQDSPFDEHGKDYELPFEPNRVKKMLQKGPFRPLKRPFRKINCTVRSSLRVRLAANAGNERIEKKDSKQSWPGVPTRGSRSPHACPPVKQNTPRKSPTSPRQCPRKGPARGL